MAFSYFTIRPATKSRDDGYVVYPSGTAVGVTTDHSEATYIYKSTGFSSPVITFTLADPSPAQPAAGTFVYYAKAKLRAYATNGTYGSLACNIGLGTTDSNAVTTYFSQGYSTLNFPATITTITSASRAATGIITATTAAAHGRSVGDLIYIQGSTTGTPANFLNHAYRILTVGTSTTFTAQDIRGAQTASTVNATNGNLSIASNVDSNPIYSNPNGGPWTQTDINNLRLYLADSSALPGATLAELYAEVITATLPTITSAWTIDGDTTSAYVVTTTTRPVISWTYSQAESLPQTAWAIKVFTTDPGAGAAETTAALWSSSGTGTTNSATVGTDLTNGSTYYVYVKVGTSGTAGATAANYGAWVGTSFSLTLTAPTTPTLSSATWSAANQKATISVTGGASYAPGSQEWQLQRSDDGGTTWKYVRGATRTTAAGVAPGTWSVDDYEPVRGGTARYRVRSVGTAGSVQLASAWTAGTNVAITAVTTWNMIALTSTGLSGSVQADVKVLGDLDLSQDEGIGVFAPQGRTRKIVIHGTITGEDGQYEILANTIATRDSMLAVINSQLNVLVIDPFGEQKYVRFTQRQIKQTGPASAPRFYITAGYVEVDSGLVAG